MKKISRRYLDAWNYEFRRKNTLSHNERCDAAFSYANRKEKYGAECLRAYHDCAEMSTVRAAKKPNTPKEKIGEEIQSLVGTTPEFMESLMRRDKLLEKTEIIRRLENAGRSIQDSMQSLRFLLGVE